MVVDNVDRIDIRKLTIEEPPAQDNRHFVLEEEVDPKIVKSSVENLYVRANALRQRARSLAFLARLLKINPKFRQSIFAKLQDEFSVILQTGAWRHLPKTFAVLKLAEPTLPADEVAKSYRNNFNPWHAFKNECRWHEGNVQTFLDLKICLPDSFSSFQFGPMDKEAMLKYLQDIDDPAKALNYGANIKMLCNFNTSELFSKEKLNEIKEYYESVKRGNNPMIFMATVADMAVIEAERVEFDNSGNINLIPRKKAVTPELVRPLPEMKKF